MSNFRRLALLPVVFSVTTTCAWAAQSTPATKPAPAKVVSSAPLAVEDAKSDFPCTLHGVFGIPGRAEASLRCAGADKSAWLHPGQKINGWTLVSVDSAKVAVVLSKDGRRVRLHRAGETSGLITSVDESCRPESDEDETDDEGNLVYSGSSPVMRKLDEVCRADVRVANFMAESEAQAFERFAKSHPQFVSQTEHGLEFASEKPGALLAFHSACYKSMLESKSPEADAVRPMVEALRDASLRVFAETNSPRPVAREDWSRQNDMWREADRLFTERQSRQ